MARRLAIKDKKFYFGDQRVFFFGAWPFDYKGDYFGNDRYEAVQDELIGELDGIQSAGGNLVLIDVHKLGVHTPVFDEDLFVTATDKTGSLPSDLRKYLDEAKKRNVFVHLLLSSFAFKENRLTKNAMHVDKVQSYIDNCLIPIVKELSGHPALLGYCVFAEPEFNLDTLSCSSGPFTSNFLAENYFTIHVADVRGKGHYRGHVNYPTEGYTFEVVLRYINMLADAIHRTDAEALVSVIPRSATTVNCNESIHPNTKNFYSDELLLKAGGKELGKLDFLAIREKPWGPKNNPNDQYDYWSKINLVNNHADDFKQTKPIMIGYLPLMNLGEGDTLMRHIEAAYRNGYAGLTALDFRLQKGNRQTIEAAMKNFKSGTVYDKTNGEIVGMND